MGLSVRWKTHILLFAGIVVVYTLRVNMSVAVTTMKDDLNWSESEKDFILSAFYIGYTVGQIPSSILCQIYGVKYVFGLSVLIPSILTLLVPVACRHSVSTAVLVRVIIGLFESANFPSVYYYFATWIPSSEKTMTVPFLLSGMYVGEIVGFSLSGLVISLEIDVPGGAFGGWPWVFYIFGLVGILWYPLWQTLFYNTPQEHPHVAIDELNLLLKGKPVQNLSRRIDNFEKSSLNPLLEDSGHDGSSECNQVNSGTEGTPTTSSTNADDRDSVNTGTGSQSGLSLQDKATLRTSNESSGDSSSKNKRDGAVSPMHTGDQTSGTTTTTTKLDNPDESDPYSSLTPAEVAARTPYFAIFTHPASVSLLVNNWAFGFIGFLLLSEMPSYLHDELNFSSETAGYLCVFPYLGLFLSSNGFAQIFNHLERTGAWDVRTVRQVAQFIGLGVPSLALIVLGYVPGVWAGFAVMTFACTACGAMNSGFACVYTEISPRYSSVINTLGNTLGALAGICGPVFLAAFINSQQHTRDGWRAMFWLVSAVNVVALTVFYIFQTSDLVPALNDPAPLAVKEGRSNS